MEMRAKPVADALLAEYSARTAALKDSGITPTLAVVRVGEREDDLAYERGILKRFDMAGASAKVHTFPEDITTEKLAEAVTALDKDPQVHGILMFRPLPRHLDEELLRNLVSSRKDVDCMGDENRAHVFSQDGKGYPPCTPEAVVEMMKFYNVPMEGKKVTVVGRSMVVGRPLAMLLLKENATVTICHTRTKDLPAECKNADIICAAAGSAGMIGADCVRSGQIIMDVGINVVDGQLCGDVDFEAVKDVAQGITPVPGGVGGVTTTMLLKHVIRSAEEAK